MLVNGLQPLPEAHLMLMTMHEGQRSSQAGARQMVLVRQGLSRCLHEGRLVLLKRSLV